MAYLNRDDSIAALSFLLTITYLMSLQSYCIARGTSKRLWLNYIDFSIIEYLSLKINKYLTNDNACCPYCVDSFT